MRDGLDAARDTVDAGADAVSSGIAYGNAAVQERMQRARAGANRVANATRTLLGEPESEIEAFVREQPLDEHHRALLLEQLRRLR